MTVGGIHDIVKYNGQKIKNYDLSDISLKNKTPTNAAKTFMIDREEPVKFFFYRVLEVEPGTPGSFPGMMYGVQTDRFFTYLGQSDPIPIDTSNAPIYPGDAYDFTDSVVTEPYEDPVHNYCYDYMSEAFDAGSNPIKGVTRENDISNGLLVIFAIDDDHDGVPDKYQNKGTVSMEDWIYGEEASDPTPTLSGPSAQLYSEQPVIEYKAADDSEYTTEKPCNAGSYIVRATWKQDGIDTITAETEFTIKKRPICLYYSNADNHFTYNSQEQTLTATIEGTTILEETDNEFTYLTFADGDKLGFVNGERLKMSGVGIAYGQYRSWNHWNSTNKGLFTIINSANEDVTDNYTGKFAMRLYIDPKPVTVTADSYTVAYRDPIPPLTAKVEGTLGNDTITYNLTREEGINAGEYTITPEGEKMQGNYAVTYIPGILTISPLDTSDCTATISQENWIYGDEKEPVCKIEGPDANNYGEPKIEYGYFGSHFINGEWTDDPMWSENRLIETCSWDPYEQYSPKLGGYVVKATWSDPNGNLPDVTAETHYNVYRRPIRIQTPSLAKIYDGKPAEARNAKLVGGEYQGINYYDTLAYNDSFHFDPNSFHSQTDVTMIAGINSGDAGFNNTCDWWIEDKYGDIVAASYNPSIVANYQILEDIGGIAVYRRPVVFKSESLSKVFDGASLSDFEKNGMSVAELIKDGAISCEHDYNEFNDKHATGPNLGVGGLLPEDAEKVTITFTGERTPPGTTEKGNRFTVNWNGVKMTNYYTGNSYGNLTVTDGEFEVVIQANSAEYTYDGTEKIAEGFSSLSFQNQVNSTGELTFELNGQTYTVEGLTARTTETQIGTYPVTITGTPVVRDAQKNDVTSSFKVTTLDGELVINPAPSSPSIPSTPTRYTVTVNYVDDAGNTLQPSTSTSYAYGSSYTVDVPPTINGYTYDHANGNLTGTVQSNITVTLVYTTTIDNPDTPLGTLYTLTVNYVDEDGNTIRASYEETYNDGDEYEVEIPAIKGYEYDSADGELKGTITDNTVVTLIYKQTTDIEDDDTPKSETPGSSNNPGSSTTTITSGSTPQSSAPSSSYSSGSSNNSGSSGSSGTASGSSSTTIEDTAVPLGDAPQTGDESPLVLWTILLLGALLGMTAISTRLIADRKRR